MKKNRKDFITCGQMKILEQRADRDGLSYYQMMENAGTCATETIVEKMAYRAADIEDKKKEQAAEYKKAAEKIMTQLPAGQEAIFEKHLENSIKSANDDIKVFLFCGKGNNGGDGFVVARLLVERGYKATVILVDGEPTTPDAITNFGLLKELPVRVLDMSRNDRALMELRETPDIIVDAIYGTGFRSKLESNGLKAAIYINKHSEGKEGKEGAVVFALDIPSGMSGDLVSEKRLDPSSVKADYTITFHARKPVHLKEFALPYCGEIIVADIGIDGERLLTVEIEDDE
ncbi:MAG: NAD(P)H-hydrate epimerase [Bacillota bacterium]|nr:NAD(P)H-hydrate epimerase [Bacillota bacterium]